MIGPMKIGDGGVSDTVGEFAHWVGRSLPETRILELGTLRSDPNFPTHHREWNPLANWVFSDIEEGVDVDIPADAHTLAPFADAAFDAIVAVSVWEHLARPWLACHAAYRVLKPGGRMYVATHQSFPIHGYPDDYFRFSDHALALIFEDAGFIVDSTDYSYPAQIIPPPEVTRWNSAAPVYLNVDAAMTKP
jgi:SAM-dependent methyltransferase